MTQVEMIGEFNSRGWSRAKSPRLLGPKQKAVLQSSKEKKNSRPNTTASRKNSKK